MAKKDTDYIFKKVVAFIELITLILCAASIVTTIIFKENELGRDISIIVMIISGVLFFLISLGIIIQNIVLYKMNKKIRMYMHNGEFEKGLEYLNGFRKRPLWHDYNRLMYYYKGLFNLYLDKVEEAKNYFAKIDCNDFWLNASMVLGTIGYSLLIYKETNEQDKIDMVLESYKKREKRFKKSKNISNTYAHIIGIIDNFVAKDYVEVKNYLHERRMPLVQRFVENN